MNFHHGYFIIYFIIFVNSVYIVCIHFIMYSFLLLTSTYTNNYIFIVIMVWNIFHLQRNKIYLCIKFKLLQNWSILLSIQKLKSLSSTPSTELRFFPCDLTMRSLFQLFCLESSEKWNTHEENSSDYLLISFKMFRSENKRNNEISFSIKCLVNDLCRVIFKIITKILI